MSPDKCLHTGTNSQLRGFFCPFKKAARNGRGGGGKKANSKRETKIFKEKKLKRGEKKTQERGKKIFRQTGERSAIEGPIHTPTHPPLLSLDCGMKKQWLF